MTKQSVTLYGMVVSGNTARARSYLIKADIPYCERAPSTAHYLKTVVPLAGGVRTMPTLEFPDVRVIRDFHTRKVMPPFVDVAEMTRLSHENTRKATRKFGVNPQTRELVERLYADQLAALDRHFAAHPYLLGGRPCIGDFGMMIFLFPHLGRDPKPIQLMLANGLNVFRWVERMNRREPDFVEFEGRDDTYLDDDEIPETLIDLLGVFAEDFVPETLAAAEVINAWIAGQDELAPGTACAQGVGYGEFDVRGTTISALAAPYRFYLLKRAQDEYAALEADDRQSLDAILESCNMAPLIGATLTRDIGRKDNLEVWL